MKIFKIFMVSFCLAVLITACGTGKKFEPPDKAPTCKIETSDRAVYS